jgi:hypothetical protein
VVVRWTENGAQQQDSTLFILAVASFIGAWIIIWLRREQLYGLLFGETENEQG